MYMVSTPIQGQFTRGFILSIARNNLCMDNSVSLIPHSCAWSQQKCCQCPADQS